MVGSSHQYLFSPSLLHFRATSPAAGASQPSISKPLYDVTNGACAQFVFTRPPCVAQSSAFQIELYTPIAWSFGKGMPLCSKLECTLIGVSSTRNLNSKNRVNEKLQKQSRPALTRTESFWSKKNRVVHDHSLLT